MCSNSSLSHQYNMSLDRIIYISTKSVLKSTQKDFSQMYLTTTTTTTTSMTTLHRGKQFNNNI